jgi:predicted amidohydrolase YtcJ
MFRINAALVIAFLIFCGVGCTQKQKADMIIYGATVYTADSSFSVKQALVVKGGKIIATGTNEQILDTYEAPVIENAKGQFIYPGFIDAHCHFTGYATDLWKCDVTGTSSFEEVLEKLKQYATTAKTTWLYARGWDQNDWAVKEFPGKTVLDSLFPETPVFLKRVDGHVALVNQRALDLAGVTASTKTAGGIVEIKDGKPTGILFDKAMDLVENRIPLIADELALQYFLQMQDSCFQYGITGVHDCGISEHTVDLVDAAQKSGQLQMKIFALLTDSAHYFDRWIRKGIYKTPLLHVGGFKVYADGALGSRGACLLHPYSDKPGWSGFLLSSGEYLRSTAKTLAASGFQMCTHAIGDSAGREMLKLYGEALKGQNNRRWRIEHAQVINESDFSLFKKYNIIPSVQPTHATSDMYWAGDRLGEERLKNAYAYKKLLAQNGWIALGTDFPVEDINPFKTFFAAVERQDSKGYPAGGFQKENALTRKEALLGMTAWAAKAAFEENEKGSIETGKAADFFICDKDLMTVDAGEILKTTVLSTFVNGKKVFTR